MANFAKRQSSFNIAGAQASLHNGQLLVSSGNPSMDYILGGGLPVGSLLLVEEDKYVTYSNVVCKYFLAEGVAQKHSGFMVSLNEDPRQFVKRLPSRVAVPEPNQHSEHVDSPIPATSMRIAWRYNALPKIDSTSQASRLPGNYYDLTKDIEPHVLDKVDMSYWPPVDGASHDDDVRCGRFTNTSYTLVLQKLFQTAGTDQFRTGAENNSHKKNILRICLKSFGSALWYDDNFAADLCRFMVILKSIVRNSLSVCLITMPIHLIKLVNDNLPEQIYNHMDAVVRLESFAGSERETNPLFRDYNGLLHIRKLAPFNALASFSPDTVDLAFKLRRRQFLIEKLHLPPELANDEAESESGAVSVGCQSGLTRNKLDF